MKALSVTSRGSLEEKLTCKRRNNLGPFFVGTNTLATHSSQPNVNGCIH